MTAKEYLNLKGISDNVFMETGTTDLIESLLMEFIKLNQPIQDNPLSNKYNNGFCPECLSKNCRHNKTCIKCNYPFQP